MNRSSLRALTTGAVIAALYAAAAFVSSLSGLGFGPVQLRLSEALCLLPLICPSAVAGLTVGCFIANLLSPFGLPDLIFGTLATFLAASITRRCKKEWLAGLAPVVCNTLIVGAMLTAEEAGFSAAAWSLFFYHGFTVGIGEALAVYLLGLPLLHYIRKKDIWGD